MRNAASFVLRFPYACPEPVLANHRFVSHKDAEIHYTIDENKGLLRPSPCSLRKVLLGESASASSSPRLSSSETRETPTCCACWVPGSDFEARGSDGMLESLESLESLEPLPLPVEVEVEDARRAEHGGALRARRACSCMRCAGGAARRTRRSARLRSSSRPSSLWGSWRLGGLLLGAANPVICVLCGMLGGPVVLGLPTIWLRPRCFDATHGRRAPSVGSAMRDDDRTPLARPSPHPVNSPLFKIPVPPTARSKLRAWRSRGTSAHCR